MRFKEINKILYAFSDQIYRTQHKLKHYVLSGECYIDLVDKRDTLTEGFLISDTSNYNVITYIKELQEMIGS